MVTQDGRISVDVIDARIDAVLAELSKKAPLHVKGRPGGGETLTLHFSGLTVEEALHKIMAGYNYVLFFPPEGRKGTATLTIVSKAVYGATPPSVPAPPQPADQQAAQRPSRSGGRIPLASPVVPEQAAAPSSPDRRRARNSDHAAASGCAASARACPARRPTGRDRPASGPAASCRTDSAARRDGNSQPAWRPAVARFPA